MMVLLMLFICCRKVQNLLCSIQGWSEDGFEQKTLPRACWLAKLLLLPYRSL